MLIGSSLTHVDCNLGGSVAQGLARVHRVLGMSQVGHVRQACSIRADIDNGSLAAPFQHWQQAFCDCECANNIDVQCLLKVIHIPVSINVSAHTQSITLQPCGGSIIHAASSRSCWCTSSTELQMYKLILMQTKVFRYSLVLCSSIVTQHSSIVDQVVNPLWMCVLYLLHSCLRPEAT